MPIYEYRCDACGDTFEVLQRFSDEPIETCDMCGGSVKKVLHPVAIHFKGSGFYTTDYARKSISSPGAEGKTEGKGADGKSGDSSPASASADAGESRTSDKAKTENRQKQAEKQAAAAVKDSSSSK